MTKGILFTREGGRAGVVTVVSGWRDGVGGGMVLVEGWCWWRGGVGCYAKQT